MSNLQGTYKFYNLVTGKKIKRHMFTPSPMPNSVIKKVETFGAGKQDGFNFADCNGTLFEWNNKADALKGKGVVDEDIILYPSITAEFPGVARMCHITPIKEEFEPHGHAEDATARSANFGPVIIAGVNAHAIPANPDEIDDIGDNDNDITHIGDIHPISTRHKT
jgi:hypothetical protein